MPNFAGTVDDARDEVSASSSGGAPFLVAYGATMVACALLALVLPRTAIALVAMFQGSVALPAAFWLERRLRVRPASPENPLKPLSVQLAMSQVVALPAVIVTYSLDPDMVPVVLAAIGGGHFLPYAWLHRTNAYAALATAVALGAFALQVLLRDAAFPVILAYVGVAYWVAAPIVYRRAARLVAAAAAAA
jgi:hypothetical protein